MISIIVPSFNETESLTRLINHLVSINGIEEIIVVDSSNQSLPIKLVKELRNNHRHNHRISIINSEKPARARQMNQGAAIATQEILLFLHCDTRIPDNVVSSIKNCFDSGYHWGRFTVRLDSQRKIFRVIELLINLRSRCRNIATGDQAIFISRDLFFAHGQYPEIPLMEDVALSTCLGKKIAPALINRPVITSARRWQNHGVLKTILLMWKLRLLFWLGTNPKKLAAMYSNDR